MNISSKLLLIFFCVILFQCNTGTENLKNSLQGSWFYFYDEIYFELHITDNRLIYHSDIMGTQIKPYKLTNDKLIKVYEGENDHTPTTINIINLNENDAIIEQDYNTFHLKRLDIETIDPQKILEVDSPYYKTFLDSFKERKANNESSITL